MQNYKNFYKKKFFTKKERQFRLGMQAERLHTHLIRFVRHKQFQFPTLNDVIVGNRP